MTKKDEKIVSKVVQKVLKEFDYDIDDILEAEKEEVEEVVKEEVMDNIDEEPPYVDWIQLAELDKAEKHKNKNGDFLSN